jgi:outer membrane protein
MMCLVCELLLAPRAKPADLVDLYTLAQANDPTFQSARHTLEAAKQKKPEAFSALLPIISANATASRTRGRTRYTGTPEISRQFDSNQWTLELTQPLFRADRLLVYDAAAAAVEQAVEQYNAAQIDLILRLTRAYFDELVAERHVTATRAQVDALSEQLKAAQRSFDSGVASITDVDDTRSRTALAEAQQVAASNDLDSSRAALEAIIGEPAPPLAALATGSVLPKPMPADVDSWVARALTDNPSVMAAQAAVKQAEYELDRSLAQRLPSVDLVATYGGNYAGGNINEPVNFGTNVHDRQVSIQISLPLLDGGGMHAQVVEARAQRAKAQSDLSATQRKVTLDARLAYAAVLSGISQVRALETALAAGQRSVKGNRAGYGLGIRINSDVLNAEQQLFGTQQDLDKARYDALFAGLKLEAAAGELSAEDLKGVNRLFLSASPMTSGDGTSRQEQPR